MSARKDAKGRNTILKLKYFDGFLTLVLQKEYRLMNIHERICVRTAYCGNKSPIDCIRDIYKRINNPYHE